MAKDGFDQKFSINDPCGNASELQMLGFEFFATVFLKPSTGELAWLWSEKFFGQRAEILQAHGLNLEKMREGGKANQ